MKRFILLIVLSFPSVFIIAQDFEGTIQIYLEGQKQLSNTYSIDVKNFKAEIVEAASSTFLFTLKNDRTTLEIELSPEETIKIIADKNADKATQIITKDKKQHATTLGASYFENQDKGSSKTLEVTKTGATKMIRGFLCDEYSVSNGKIWATSQIDVNLSERMFILGTNGFYDRMDGVDGFIIEMKGKDEEGNEFLLQTTIETKAIDNRHFETDLDNETQKLLNKHEKMLKIAEEFRQKMLEAGEDMEKIKALSEEMKTKMQELQN